MPYIGKQPLTGAYQLCDTITTSATATYNLLVGGSAVIPGVAQNCIVSLNGVIQAPISAFTVSGSQITFASTLSATDVIDFILILGNVFDIGTPTNGSVTNASIANSTINLTTKVTGVLPVANGGTGLSALGTSLQVLRTNTGATALEFATISSTSNVKAWVNFNGVGTPSIRASLNVSSITDNGTGDYTVNFTTALADANYAVAGDGSVGTTLDPGQYNRGPTLCGQTLSSSSFRFRTSQLWTTAIEELANITYIVTR